MNVRTALKTLCALSLLAAPAAFASPTTFDFTGTLTDARGSVWSFGDSISGTFTFDLANAIPSESFGIIGDSLGGFVANSDGASIFDATLTIDGVTYDTSTQLNETSTVYADQGDGYQAMTESLGGGIAYDVDLYSTALNGDLALADGSPNLTVDGGFTGDITETTNNKPARGGSSASFALDSITPATAQVPAPASLGLLGLGLIGAAFARRRKDAPRLA